MRYIWFWLGFDSSPPVLAAKCYQQPNMNAIDYHYFNFLNAHYDWEKHLINVNCPAGDLNILDPEKEVTDEGLKNASVFIHEYIHYLQNFSTTWGSTIFADFTFALIKVGASSADNKDIISLPIKETEINNPLFFEGLKLRKEVISKINLYNEFEIEDGHQIQYKLVDVKKKYLSLTNGKITLPLSGKVIREHMAHLGTLLFLEKDDINIHQYNSTFKGFSSNGNEFSNQAEYWIIYEYYYSFEIFTNLPKGLFNLMQKCLATNIPENSLKQFNDWLLTIKPKLKKVDFNTLVEKWASKPHMNEIFLSDLNESKAHCQKILKIVETHMHENHLLEFAYNILSYIIDNIESSCGGQNLYNSKDNLDSLKYWNRKVAKYGSGIVRYSDKTMIHGSDEHCTKMEDSFLFLISSSFVINKIIKNQKSNCPFLEDIPICVAKYKGEDGCYQNPFKMIKESSHEKQCTFANGVLLLGFQNRIN